MAAASFICNAIWITVAIQIQKSGIEALIKACFILFPAPIIVYPYCIVITEGLYKKQPVVL